MYINALEYNVPYFVYELCQYTQHIKDTIVTFKVLTLVMPMKSSTHKGSRESAYQPITTILVACWYQG